MKKITVLIAVLFFTISAFAQSASDTLIATATPGANTTIVSYAWKQTFPNGNSPVITSFNPSGNRLIFTVTLAGNYTIDCTATDSQGQTITKTTYITAYLVGKPTMIINPPSSSTSPIILKLNSQ